MNSSFRFSKIALVSVGFAAALLPARADVVIMSDPGNEGGAQIQYYIPIGQSFTAAGDVLLGFDFFFDTFNSKYANPPITLSIHEGAGTSGTVLDSKMFSLPDNYQGWGGAAFALDLISGGIYTATLETSNPYWGIRLVPGSDTYSGGNAFISGKPLEGQETTDLVFRATFADAHVPEITSTAAVFLIGLLGLGAVRRRMTV